jgi:hypothetical protein
MMTKLNKQKPTIPPDDVEFPKIIARIREASGGLPWVVRETCDLNFKSRLEQHGIAVFEGDGCWIWSKKGEGKSKRPYWLRKDGSKPTAPRVLIAAYLNQQLAPGHEVEAAHICPNTMCVRPGGRHVVPLDVKTHRAFDRERKSDAGFTKDVQGLMSIEVYGKTT